MKKTFFGVVFILAFICKTQAESHSIKLLLPKGRIEVFKCPDNVTILDQAEKEGIDLCNNDYSGVTSSSLAKVVTGVIDQCDQNFLDSDQLNEKFVLISSAYPKSDCTLEVAEEKGKLKSGPQIYYAGTVRADNDNSAEAIFIGPCSVDLYLYNCSVTGAIVIVDVNRPFCVYSKNTTKIEDG
jgi:Ferredoxin